MRASLSLVFVLAIVAAATVLLVGRALDNTYRQACNGNPVCSTR